MDAWPPMLWSTTPQLPTNLSTRLSSTSVPTSTSFGTAISDQLISLHAMNQLHLPALPRQIHEQSNLTTPWKVPPPQQLFDLLNLFLQTKSMQESRDNITQPEHQIRDANPASPTAEDLSLPRANRVSDKWEASSDLNQSDHVTFGTLPSPSTNSSPTECNSTLQNCTPTNWRYSANESANRLLDTCQRSPSKQHASNCTPSCFQSTRLSMTGSLHPLTNLLNPLKISNCLNMKSSPTSQVLPQSSANLSDTARSDLHQTSLQQYYSHFLRQQQQQYYIQYEQWIRSFYSKEPNSESEMKVSPSPVSISHSKSTKLTRKINLKHSRSNQNESPRKTRIISPPHLVEAEIEHADSRAMTTPSNRTFQTGNAYACKLCNKTYSQPSALKMHVRTHTLPCRCSHCGKSFSRKWLLKGHERTHTGERPYACTICTRSFADRSNLRAHMQTHQREKRYTCPNCPRSFSRMGLLNKHLTQCICRTPSGSTLTGSSSAHGSSRSVTKAINTRSNSLNLLGQSSGPLGWVHSEDILSPYQASHLFRGLH